MNDVLKFNREAVKKAKQQGWRVEQGKHYKLYPPDASYGPIVLGHSPCGNPALLRYNKRKLIRAGLKL